ncbi:MAG TPA: ATP-binding cassette domain-containing protein [Pyrinomonadaceae bacterium]|nr:ATP-binding cassette domain-containing protein [Pyrinomonadaceae bacterium]
MTEKSGPVVEFRGVTYAVGHASTRIIDGLDLEVRRGETLVLLGESGCGKTTTLRLANRMLVPTEGAVKVEGRDTREWDAVALRRRAGYVIQEAGLFPHFTVERNVALVPALEGWPEARTRERVRELLALVGLDPEKFARRYPRELSGGQRQRVGVARALAADPPLLLLDEPFGALDPLTRASLQREFAALQKRLGKTCIFVTHDVREALLLGTRVGLMHAGRLLLVETPENFLRSTDARARAYRETLRLPAPALAALADETTTKDAAPRDEGRDAATHDVRGDSATRDLGGVNG